MLAGLRREDAGIGGLNASHNIMQEVGGALRATSPAPMLAGPAAMAGRYLPGSLTRLACLARRPLAMITQALAWGGREAHPVV